MTNISNKEIYKQFLIQTFYTKIGWLVICLICVVITGTLSNWINWMKYLMFIFLIYPIILSLIMIIYAWIINPYKAWKGIKND